MQIIKEFYLPQKINNKLHFGSLIRIFQFLVSRMKIQLFFPPPKMRVDIFFGGWGGYSTSYMVHKKRKKKKKKSKGLWLSLPLSGCCLHLLTFSALGPFHFDGNANDDHVKIKYTLAFRVLTFFFLFGKTKKK